MIVRPWLGGVAALVGAALVVAGCGASQDPAGGSGSVSASGSAAGTASGDGGVGGTLRIGAVGLPPGLGDPFVSMSANAVKNVLPAVFDRLTDPTTEGLQPALATEWEQSEDLLSWDFTLRSDVQFGNGEPFNADAVVAAFDYLLTGAGQSSVIAPDYATLDKVEAIDEHTVRMTTSTPNPALPRDVTQVFIPAPQYFAEVGAEEFAKKPVGTGPYQAVSWSAEQIDLEQAPDSWRQATYNTVTFQALPDPTARVQALQSDQIDLALSLPAGTARDLETQGLKYQAAPQGTVLAIQFVNTKDETPLSDVRVRRALNLAVDRQSIIDAILLGQTRPANQGAVPGAIGYVEDLEQYPYDPEQAKALLAEAGVADGYEFTVQLSGEAGDTPDIMQAVATNLEAVGIKMAVQGLPFAQWLEKLKTNSFDGPAFSIGYTSQPDYNSLRAYRTISCFQEPAFWCDDEQTTLIETAAAATTEEQFDTEMQNLGRWTHENPPSLFILESAEFIGINNTINTTAINATGGINLDQTTSN